jgi:hypothetical protein
MHSGSAISIMSKYVLRVKGVTSWNPSNFGLSVCSFLPQNHGGIEYSVGQLPCHRTGNRVLGSIIIWRASVSNFRDLCCCIFSVRFPSQLAYGSSMARLKSHLSLARMYQLFVFFMITIQKHTVKSKWGQCVVVFLVAFVEFILRLMQVIYAPFYALFLVGPAANVIGNLVGIKTSEGAYVRYALACRDSTQRKDRQTELRRTSKIQAPYYSNHDELKHIGHETSQRPNQNIKCESSHSCFFLAS